MMKYWSLHWDQTLSYKSYSPPSKDRNGSDVADTNSTKYWYHSTYKNRHTPWTRDWDATKSNMSTEWTLSRHAENNFLKKSRILGDLTNPVESKDSLRTVFLIAGLFLFITILVTGAVAVFCRKKNSVFALQKSEQEDIDDVDYELDEFDSSTEFYDSDSEIPRPHLSASRNHLDVVYHDSPVHLPLVHHDMTNSCTSLNNSGEECYLAQQDMYESCSDVDACGEGERSSVTEDGVDGRVNERNRGSGKMNGECRYHQMVVTAVMEQNQTSTKTTTTKSMDYHSAAYTHVAAGGGGGDVGGGGGVAHQFHGDVPVISITYGDNPPSYDSIRYEKQCAKDSCQNLNNNSATDLPAYSQVDETLQHKKCSSGVETMVYVDLPGEEKVPIKDGANVVYVDVPVEDVKGAKCCDAKDKQAKYVYLPEVKCSKDKRLHYGYEQLRNDSSDTDATNSDSNTQHHQGHQCNHVVCKHNKQKLRTKRYPRDGVTTLRRDRNRPSNNYGDRDDCGETRGRLIDRGSVSCSPADRGHVVRDRVSNRGTSVRGAIANNRAVVRDSSVSSDDVWTRRNSTKARGNQPLQHVANRERRSDYLQGDNRQTRAATNDAAATSTAAADATADNPATAAASTADDKYTDKGLHRKQCSKLNESYNHSAAKLTHVSRFIANNTELLREKGTTHGKREYVTQLSDTHKTDKDSVAIVIDASSHAC